MLTCGNNAALDSITSKIDEIKGKLADGMSALSDLESKANAALGELQAALPQIPSIGPSLQGDVSALITQMQTDAGGAIAAFKAQWGSALSDSELQGYIDQVTAAISDPLSLASFDPCDAIPNKELDSATGEVIAKAKEVKIPDAKPAKLPSFSEIVTKIPAITLPDGTITPAATITGPTTIDLTAITSSVSPAGTSRSSSGFGAALNARGKVLEKINKHFTPKVKAARIAYEAEKKKPEYGQTGGSGINGSGAAKRHRLYTTGKMSTSQVKWYEKFLDLEIDYHNVQVRRDNIKDQLVIYIEYLTGRVTKENFDKGEKQFKDDFKANLEEVGGASELASDMSLYETGKTELDANKSDFQGVGKHNNQVVSSVSVQ